MEGEHPAQQKICHATCEINLQGLMWPVEQQSGRLECNCIQRLGPIVFKGPCEWKMVEDPECDVPEPTEPPGQMHFGYPENYGKTTESPTTTTAIATTTTTTTTSTTEFNVVPIPCLPYIKSKPKKVPRICREYMPTTTTTSTTTTTTTTTTTKKSKTKRKISACQELFENIRYGSLAVRPNFGRSIVRPNQHTVRSPEPFR